MNRALRILFLSHSFNSLTQRLYDELAERGHEISVEFDINDSVTVDAARLYQPDLVVAPYLRRAIPEAVWRRHVCLVLHPGIRGDRGPSALDWAIVNEEAEWGVTVLQANAQMDGGDIWASAGFPMRAARKSSLYRNEVTEAAVTALLAAVDRFQSGAFVPQPLDVRDPAVRGRARPLMRQAQRRIDWLNDDSASILRKIRSADGAPGVEDEIFGQPYLLFDACAEGSLRGRTGEIIARRDGAICRATRDGAVWIGHLRRIVSDERTFKLPAVAALGPRADEVAELPLPPDATPGVPTYREISYAEEQGVGYLYFDFYNGAMSSAQCTRLLHAYRRACARPTRVIVLFGGRDFWSNGIHLNVIESAESPADESWRNINAMDDLAQAIITTTSHLTISAMRGNAGAGGVFLALAADHVWARTGVILNPHYKSMGNLYGSEYWTYLLPKRVGRQRAEAITENRLPLGVCAARRLGLIDDHFGDTEEEFRQSVRVRAREIADDPAFLQALAYKNQRRSRDEDERPLQSYREEELERLRMNFYGFDPSYHVARYHFVHRVPHSWTPLHLARHRRLDWGRESAERRPGFGAG